MHSWLTHNVIFLTLPDNDVTIRGRHQWIRQAKNLATIGGVGKILWISNHSCVEHGLSGCTEICSERNTFEHCAIFEYEACFPEDIPVSELHVHTGMLVFK